MITLTKYESLNECHCNLCPHYLHVPDKLLRLRKPASVGKQSGVVLLLGDEEVLLLVLLRDGAVIVSIPEKTFTVTITRH